MDGTKKIICCAATFLLVCLCLIWSRGVIPFNTKSNEPTNVPTQQSPTDRKITDIDFNNFVTEGEVITAWGPPDAYADYAGTNNFFWVYYVEDREMWMVFDAKPPHLVLGFNILPRAAKIVPKRRTRNLNDLTITNGITYGQVTAVWGRPDGFAGSGVNYYVYHLENGQKVLFVFDTAHPPYRAEIAILLDKKGTTKSLF